MARTLPMGHNAADSYKPCHIITNDPFLSIKLLTGIDYELGSEDYTEEEGRHYHFLVHWPRNSNTERLTPTRNVAIRRWRRENPFQPGFKFEQRCHECYDRAYGSRCINCGLFYKIIWCHSPEHEENTKKYIEDKWIDHPEWRLAAPNDPDPGNESDED